MDNTKVRTNTFQLHKPQVFQMQHFRNVDSLSTSNILYFTNLKIQSVKFRSIINNHTTWSVYMTKHSVFRIIDTSNMLKLATCWISGTSEIITNLNTITRSRLWSLTFSSLRNSEYVTTFNFRNSELSNTLRDSNLAKIRNLISLTIVPHSPILRHALIEIGETVDACSHFGWRDRRGTSYFRLP